MGNTMQTSNPLEIIWSQLPRLWVEPNHTLEDQLLEWTGFFEEVMCEVKHVAGWPPEEIDSPEEEDFITGNEGGVQSGVTGNTGKVMKKMFKFLKMDVRFADFQVGGSTGNALYPEHPSCL